MMNKIKKLELSRMIEWYIISRKGAKPAKENKDKFFNNLSVFAPLFTQLNCFCTYLTGARESCLILSEA
jgi:hypothetical protein